jgi:CRISPR-associated endonuclease/helicase Cas3
MGGTPDGRHSKCRRLDLAQRGPFAHSPNRRGDWDPLIDHLQRVADRARNFAECFDAADLAYVLGLWHDLGKINPDFQAYLQAAAAGQPVRKGPPHAIWGAALAFNRLQERYPDHWKILALPIAGHHSGLGEPGQLSQKLVGFIGERPESLPAMIEICRLPEMKPPKLPPVKPIDPLHTEAFIRILFSALIDADFLATEAHFNDGSESVRRDWPKLEKLWEKFQIDQAGLIPRGSLHVNQIRQEVYDACLRAADGESGFYRLTVPTGGGKTRSGLAFALKHAVGRLRRVVVALPYTSIIDQTARVYREILGDDAVLEHHSQAVVQENEQQDERALRAKLASENWDAPLIVTTTVQLFESLFSNKTSRTRKLHNLAWSVIILDEVQTLPPELLKPTLDMLRSLVTEYGATVVLSTATQPAFDDTPYITELEGIRIAEIVPDHSRHFDQLRRVRFSFRAEPVSWSDLGHKIQLLRQVLVVLNTRRDALSLLDAMKGEEDCFHLSTLLCGAHRRNVLDEVRKRLESKRPVRLISTQVVEAGVDLDFPCVYRAMGPLDRIVQVAGRCNRNGLMDEPGEVVVIEPQTGGSPRGSYRTGLEEARLLLSRHDPDDLHRPELYREYYQRLFAGVDLDKKKIQEVRTQLNFPEVASRYRLIEEETVPVVVDYGIAEERVRDWEAAPSRETWRDLQPYLVNLYTREEQRFASEGWLHSITAGLYRWIGQYNDVRGIVADALDPSDLIFGP